MYKIAFLVTRSDHIGGSHVHVRDLVLRLNQDGHEVKVFMGGDGPVIDNFKNFEDRGLYFNKLIKRYLDGKPKINI